MHGCTAGKTNASARVEWTSSIKYHLFGPRGYATVFAEAAEYSKKGEFNFIFVQFDDTHEVVTVVDPVDAATAWRPTSIPASSAAPSVR